MHIVIYVDENDPTEKHLSSILKELAVRDSRSMSSMVRNILWAGIEAMDSHLHFLSKTGRTTPKINPTRAYIAPAKMGDK